MVGVYSKQNESADEMIDRKRLANDKEATPRELQSLCPHSMTPLNDFSIEIYFTPKASSAPGGDDIGSCDDEQRRLVGLALNEVLNDHGIGDHKDSEGIYLAEVCSKPALEEEKEDGGRRHLQFGNPPYTGGGRCRNCNPDNGDSAIGGEDLLGGILDDGPGRLRRGLFQFEQPIERKMPGKGWFKLYMKKMKYDLEAAIVQDVIESGDYTACLDTDADVFVDIKAVGYYTMGCS